MTTAQIREETEKLARCYEEQVVSLRTRRVELWGRKCEPRTMYTFLGFEVKFGPKRVTCPDMTTARYLKIFGKLGMDSIQIPYDPTQTARVVPILERAMDRIDELLLSIDSDRLRRQRHARRIYRIIRQKLREAERG